MPSPRARLSSAQLTTYYYGFTEFMKLRAEHEKDPGFKERICDDNGQVRRFVNIFANDEDIRFLQNLDTPVKDSDEISIVPAIAGGR